MTHQFSQIPQANIERSSFDRSHGYKTTFDSGYLVPFYVDEVLPGDTFNVNGYAVITNIIATYPNESVLVGDKADKIRCTVKITRNTKTHIPVIRVRLPTLAKICGRFFLSISVP